jgi:protein-tyrosine phosphatase
MTRILVVCLGNTCRSPMGQGVIEHLAARAGLAVEVDSAGIGAWHAGKPPDPRGLATSIKRGYDTSAQRSRQITEADFTAFDLILAMDASNLARLRELCPAGASPEIRLFHPSGRDVPDPYYGELPDYELALDMIEEGARDLIAGLAARA